jgi:hypothetical protein
MGSINEMFSVAQQCFYGEFISQATIEILTSSLTLYLLMWRIWRDADNASKWQMGFNWAFKGLKGPIYFRF